MEWVVATTTTAANTTTASDTVTFEDRATLTVLNRRLPVPKFTKQLSTDGRTLIIRTAALNLTYAIGKPFSHNTLSVSGSWGVWTPGSGLAGKGNLLGTIKSLDQLGVISLNCTDNNATRVHDESLHCEWGLVSRDGWSVIDDSKNWGLTTGAEWWDSVNTDTYDWYFLGHGHDYKAAILDFTRIAGQTPLVPRGASGVWWTRWYDLNNLDVKKVVDDYASRGMPLDIFVVSFVLFLFAFVKVTEKR